MICLNCGKEIDNDLRVCPFCGNLVEVFDDSVYFEEAPSQYVEEGYEEDLAPIQAYARNEDYAEEEEQVCATLMDRCLERLMAEGQTETVAALLSGDEATFNAFRCEAPELVHLPEATFEWYARNYLDRDYPIRALMRWNGVDFETKRG